MTFKSIKFLSVVALLAAAVASHAATIKLDPIGTPTAGQSFDVQIRVEDPFAGLPSDEQLLAFGFHLGFDASQLKFDSFIPAAGWEDDSARLGAGIFSASIFPGVDNAGQTDLLLATLHFDALQPGFSSLSLRTDAGDFNQGLIFLQTDPVAIAASQSVTVTSPVPEPASAVLMVAALAVLARRRVLALRHQLEDDYH